MGLIHDIRIIESSCQRFLKGKESRKTAFIVSCCWLQRGGVYAHLGVIPGRMTGAGFDYEPRLDELHVLAESLGIERHQYANAAWNSDGTLRRKPHYKVKPAKARELVFRERVINGGICGVSQAALDEALERGRMVNALWLGAPPECYAERVPKNHQRKFILMSL